MGPFLVFPTGGGGGFRSHRNNTVANVGLAALGALPPDSVVTEAPGWTAQPSRTLQSLGGLQRQPCDSPAGLDLWGAGVSQNLRYFHLFTCPSDTPVLIDQTCEGHIGRWGPEGLRDEFIRGW